MSRNLGRTDCRECGGNEVWMIEPVRPMTREDCGRYFDEFEGRLCAFAKCRECEAEYLAWVAGNGRWPRENGAHGFGDLSYRSTFNDEPGDSDRAKWRIVRVRAPLDGAVAAAAAALLRALPRCTQCDEVGSIESSAEHDHHEREWRCPEHANGNGEPDRRFDAELAALQEALGTR